MKLDVFEDMMTGVWTELIDKLLTDSHCNMITSKFLCSVSVL